MLVAAVDLATDLDFFKISCTPHYIHAQFTQSLAQVISNACRGTSNKRNLPLPLLHYSIACGDPLPKNARGGRGRPGLIFFLDEVST